jgi:hypothetical protein
MIKQTILGAGALISLVACGGPASSGSAQAHNEASSTQSQLVAVEFSGSERSLDRLATEVVRLGWRVDSRSARALRILPPPNYEPSQFGTLLDRIEQMGIRDIGLRLIGPNGPVGPEG